MACDCEKKTATPSDAIRNAAALWVSSGKLAGYAEGVEMCVAQFEKYLQPLTERLKSKHRAEIATQLRELFALLRASGADQSKQAEGLSKAALAMADRLERPAPAPSLAQRVRAAAAALRG